MLKSTTCILQPQCANTSCSTKNLIRSRRHFSLTSISNIRLTTFKIINSSERFKIKTKINQLSLIKKHYFGNFAVRRCCFIYFSGIVSVINHAWKLGEFAEQLSKNTICHNLCIQFWNICLNYSP